MGRIISLSLAVLMTPMVVLSPEAKAQQASDGLKMPQWAGAVGPEFCPRGPCPGFADVRRSIDRHRRKRARRKPRVNFRRSHTNRREASYNR
jgi:hypothetical protein